MKKKICYVTTLSLTIDAFFIPQLKRLEEEGFDVTVVTSPDEGLQERLGEKIKYVPIEMPRGVSVVGSMRAVSALTKFFKKEQFDLVQYSTPNAALYASIAAKKAKVPVRNYHLMGLRFLGEKGVMRTVLKSFEKTACKNSTHIECVSPSNLELSQKERLFPEGKGVVVWNGSSGGVDLHRFDATKRDELRAEMRKKYGFAEEDFVYGFVGRVTKDKGVEELLASYQEIRAKNDQAKLVFIGSLDDAHGLSDKSLEMLKNGAVTHIQKVTDVERYYPMLDALVLPSYREGFGNVVIEAQAMGVPVVVSNIPGPTDAMQDGVTGFCVELKNVNDLVEKMNRIAEASTHECMSSATVEYVKSHFDSDKLCEYIVERKKTLLS